MKTNEKKAYSRGISIIIPTYNRPQCLKRALQSINKLNCNQLEIIVVDDNSTKQNYLENEEIIKQIQRVTNLQIILLKNETNVGVACSRNRAISTATRKWCLFLDDDDELQSTYLDFLFSIIENEPNFDIGWSDVISINDSVDKSQTLKKFDINPHNIEEKFISIGIGFGVICKTEVLLEINGFSENLKIAEDTDFFIRMLELGKSVTHFNTIGMVIHENSYNALTGNFSRYAKEHVYKKIYRKHRQFFYLKKNLSISFSYWAIQVYLMHNKKISAFNFALEVCLKNFLHKPIYNLIKYTFENLNSFSKNSKYEMF